MLFNSLEFALFLPIVFLAYWFLFPGNLRLQNFFLICASYLFYGWWDWRFLSLIALSSGTDYIFGLLMQRQDSSRKRKQLLAASVLVNLSILGTFKYFDFFSLSFQHLMQSAGWEVDVFTLNVILPVGVSFYTFQTLSYTIDVYRRKIACEKDPVAFFAFVSFFPQLVAGPIERAVHLLPQFKVHRTFSYEMGADGMRQILWGLFKKVVIADQCGLAADEIFSQADGASGGVLVLGAIYFSFQIYGDFSGYSDIAIGVAKLFGFRLLPNFRTPYFSQNISEFWRRWHISLSSWFRDYVFFPLGGSRVRAGLFLRNIAVVFVVSGLWHGANWTFVFWGATHAAMYYIFLLFRKKNKEEKPDKQIALTSAPAILLTFLACSLTWVFFRSATIGDAFQYFQGMMTHPFLPPNFYFLHIYTLLPLLVGFIMLEWFTRQREYALEFSQVGRVWVRRSFYTLLVLLILAFGQSGASFIYFQF